MIPRIPDNILTLLVTITGAVLPPRDPNNYDDEEEDEEDEDRHEESPVVREPDE
jgi:hypothetical protein